MILKSSLLPKQPGIFRHEIYANKQHIWGVWRIKTHIIFYVIYPRIAGKPCTQLHYSPMMVNDDDC